MCVCVCVKSVVLYSLLSVGMNIRWKSTVDAAVLLLKELLCAAPLSYRDRDVIHRY